MPGRAAAESTGFIAPMLATAAAGLPADAAEFVAGRSGPGPGAAATSPPPIPSSACSRPQPGPGPWSWTGEIVALSGPRPDFTTLQRRMTVGRPGAGLLAAVPITLIVFDVLHSGRDHLAGSPYVLRRALLEDLGLPVPGTVLAPPTIPSEAAGRRDNDLDGLVTDQAGKASRPLRVQRGQPFGIEQTDHVPRRGPHRQRPAVRSPAPACPTPTP